MPYVTFVIKANFPAEQHSKIRYTTAHSPMGRKLRKRHQECLGGQLRTRFAAIVLALTLGLPLALSAQQQGHCPSSSPCRVTLYFDQNGGPNRSGDVISVIPGDTVTIVPISISNFVDHVCKWKESRSCGLFGWFTCDDDKQQETHLDHVTIAIASRVVPKLQDQILGKSDASKHDYVVKQPGLLVIGRTEDTVVPNAKPRPDASCSHSVLPVQLQFQVIIAER